MSSSNEIINYSFLQSSLKDYSWDRSTVSAKKSLAGQPYSVKQMLQSLGVNYDRIEPHGYANLRGPFPEVENQEGFRICTASAVIGILEYFHKRHLGTHMDFSTLFLFQVSERFRKEGLDPSAEIVFRSMLFALTLIGVPPERYYQFDKDAIRPKDFEDFLLPTGIEDFGPDFEKLFKKTLRRLTQPSPLAFAMAQHFRGLSYFKLDDLDCRDTGSLLDVLDRIKTLLDHGVPVVFSMIYDNRYVAKPKYETGEVLTEWQKKGIFPPIKADIEERHKEKHALVAIGYDDEKIIPQIDRHRTPEKGAIMVRNSWGELWGDNGYGWLPYSYVEDGFTTNWWSMIQAEFAAIR